MKNFTLIFSLLLSTLTSQAATGKPIFIVHSSSPIKELTVNQVADLYFKKNRYWPDGTKVRFFDNGDAALKNIFYKQVLKKTARDVDLYWIGEKNFSGQGAPIEAPSDELVIGSVSSVPGAIGYISSADAELTGVKRITVKGLE